MKEDVDIFINELVSRHELLTEEQKQLLLKKLGITLKQLPRIKLTDPVSKKIAAKKLDVVKITRKSPTSVESVYYRVVV